MNRMPPLFQRIRSPKNGGAIVTVMFVIMVMMIVAGSLHAFSSAMPRRVRLMTDAIRAKAIAEAGINRGYSMLREDYAGSLSAFPISDSAFSGGQYSVRLLQLSASEVRLVSTGRFGTSDAVVGVDARNTAMFDSESRTAPQSPFRHSIFSNGLFTVNGTPKLVRGSMFTNNDFVLSGHYDNVEGLIFAQNSQDIPADNRGVWAERPFPQLTDPDFAAFIEDARAKGILTELNGNTTLPRNMVYNGVVLVRGNLTHNGSGGRTVNGMLYVTGNVEFNGSSHIFVEGSFMVGGNLTFNGSSISLCEFSYDDTHLPIDDEVPDDHVVIDAWWD
jgi:hypothetical protein